MKLDTFSVKHYKSLSDVTVKFDPNVTVIVGANSVGKSNFVDAMRFLRDAVKDDLDHAMVSRGGVARIGQRMAGASESPSFIGFEVAAIQTFVSHPPEQVSYSLSLATSQSGDGAFGVQQESAACFDEDFDLFGRNDNPILLHDRFDRKPDGHITVNDGVHPPETYHMADFDRLAIGERFGKVQLVSIAFRLSYFFQHWRFSTLYPSLLRELKVSDPMAQLREDGMNWASVVRAAEKSEHGRMQLARINEMMAYVLPDFVDVTVKVIGSYLVPQFRFKGTELDAEMREFDPIELSDGTLRIYGLLLALYQFPPPPLLVIEEPELFVHPGVLAMLAEAFKEVGEITQLVITTHSPDLVKHFAPEQIRVATMVNGVTSIGNLHHHQIEAVNEDLFTLDEFMAGEGLRPDAPTVDGP